MQTKDLLSETDFNLNREFAVRPLKNEGLNKHFISLVSADVFTSRKKSFFDIFKSFWQV